MLNVNKINFYLTEKSIINHTCSHRQFNYGAGIKLNNFIINIIIKSYKIHNNSLKNVNNINLNKFNIGLNNVNKKQFEKDFEL